MKTTRAGADIRTLTRIATAVISCTLALAACHRVSVPPVEMASRVIVTSCPPGLVPTKPTDAPSPASLTVTVRTEPQVAVGTEANLRLEGPNTRSTIRVDVTQPSNFDLEKGVYIVRVALPGYVTVEGRAPLTAGCVATMTLILKAGEKK